LNFNVGRIDGAFGIRTRDAIRRFQSLRPSRLQVDGAYGPQTKTEMENELRKL
jgi:peptidoglycan hydrolase-like protein with peptidoglycan-binding domain